MKGLKKLKNITGLHTYDFEDLYNSINLDDLKYRVMDFFKKSKEKDISIELFTDLFQFVVCENYLFEGKQIYKQVRGIPMGGSCNSILADIYLFTYEAGLLLEKNLKIYRYIDDVLVVELNNNKEIYQFKCYPDNLNLKSASVLYLFTYEAGLLLEKKN